MILSVWSRCMDGTVPRLFVPVPLARGIIMSGPTRFLSQKVVINCPAVFFGPGTVSQIFIPSPTVPQLWVPVSVPGRKGLPTLCLIFKFYFIKKVYHYLVIFQLNNYYEIHFFENRHTTFCVWHDYLIDFTKICYAVDTIYLTHTVAVLDIIYG